jgi:hypothetical protein
MTRTDLARSIVNQVGDEAIELVDLGTGWPTLVNVRISTGQVPVALHVSNASPHARKDYEWRFQNPATRPPVTDPAGSIPILIGLDTSGASDVLIVTDGRSRLNRVARFSILFNHRISTEASQNGWSEYVSGSGEHVYAMKPKLLPLAIELILGGLVIGVQPIAEAAKASGLIENDNVETANRTKRIAWTYVRDAKFSRIVRSAYNNKCGLCGVELGLVVGAHIYPVNAPNSEDRVWNGIALCHNHHSAFDSHNIWLNSDYSVRIRQEYINASTGKPESERFINQTRNELLLPHTVNDRPRRDMLIARYDYYEESYRWAPNVI